jgi:hypothetical protein
MKKHLSSFNKYLVYHFTDKRNISEIKKQGGILPRSIIQNAYIPGGNRQSVDMDNNKGMQNYVHLCFLDDHPMEFIARDQGRIDPIWLKISTDVLDIPGVLYCAGVSNAIDAIYLNAKQAIKIMDFDHLFNYYDFSIENNMELHNQAKKYEILIPTKIPLNYIRNI